MRILPGIVLVACGASFGLPPADLDTFGITRMHPTKAGTREWNSAHWANGMARRVQYDGDAGPTRKVQPQSFVNVEATGYYRRLTTGGAAYAGAELQVRTGPLAHGSSGGNLCDATGYAARFRNDGTWDFEKELKHPGSGVAVWRRAVEAGGLRHG